MVSIIIPPDSAPAATAAPAQTWKMSTDLHYHIFSIQSFTRKRVNCGNMKIATKQRVMQS